MIPKTKGFQGRPEIMKSIFTEFKLQFGTSFALLAGLCVLSACKKTVVSDKIVTITTPTPTTEPPRKGIGDGIADTQAIIKITGTKCSAERITEFAVKVAGLKNTEWINFRCNETDKEIRVDTKKGYCNVLQLRPRVSMTKNGETEEYYRESANSSHKFFFKARPATSQSSISRGVNISFEDTTDLYTKQTYEPCKKAADENKDLSVQKVMDVIEGNEKTCAHILGKVPDKPAAVDWDDFQFTVESDQVQFTVEGFPEIGCSPN